MGGATFYAKQKWGYTDWVREYLIVLDRIWQERSAGVGGTGRKFPPDVRCHNVYTGEKGTSKGSRGCETELYKGGGGEYLNSDVRVKDFI